MNRWWENATCNVIYIHSVQCIGRTLPVCFNAVRPRRLPARISGIKFVNVYERLHNIKFKKIISIQ